MCDTQQQEVKTGAQTDTKGNLPGYTGHQHAAQHVYAKSYGSTTKDLQNVEDEVRRCMVDMVDVSLTPC